MTSDQVTTEIVKPSGISHSFDIGIAAACGVEAAILYNHLCFWITHNIVTGQTYREGRTWTYQTKKEIASHFSYLTIDQVKRALDLLVKNKFVITGQFHENKFNRELWYALPDESILKTSGNSKKLFDNANLHNARCESAQTYKISNNTDYPTSTYVSKDTSVEDRIGASLPTPKETSINKKFELTDITSNVSLPKKQASQSNEKIIYSPDLTTLEVQAGVGKTVIPQEKWNDFVKQYGEERVLSVAHELSAFIAQNPKKYTIHHITLGKWIRRSIQWQAEGKLKAYRPQKNFGQDYPGAGTLPREKKKNPWERDK